MLRLSTAIALAGSMAPLGAQGQEPTPLPEVEVIAPAPLSSPRRAPPKRVQAAPLDHGQTQFAANSELGTIDQNLFVTGTGVYIDQPAAGLTPVDLSATNTYAGERPTTSSI